MRKYLFDLLNGIVILLGICALADKFDDNLNKVFLGVAAVLGAVYLIMSIVLFCFCPVKFDWHLLKGNYILKVLALVLYTPFVLTAAYSCLGDDQTPKALIFDEILYQEVTRTDSSSVSSSNLPDTIRSKQKDPSLFWGIYAHYIDPGNQHMSTTPEARMWAAVIAILGVFLVNGLLVSAIIGWIDIRKEKWLKGEVKYRFLLWCWKHYVIIGGNDMVAGIVKQLLDTIQEQKHFWKPYILIQTSRDVEAFRRELFSDLTEDQQKRIIIYYGSRTSKEDIEDLMLGKAKEVYILGEDTRTDDIESYHDTMNMECLKLVSEQVKDVAKFQEDKVQGDNRLVCRVMFEYQSTFNILQVTDIDGEKIKFLPFNYYEMWAQKVLVCQQLGVRDKYAYLPLEGVKGIKATDDSFVHFVVVGMSRMGLAMAIEAAHLAHYPNFETKKKRTRITFIDSAMEQEKHFFMGRFKEMFTLARHRDVSVATPGIYGDTENYPWMDPFHKDKYNPLYIGDYLGEDFVDVEWEFVNGSIENPNVQQYLEDAASNPDAKLTIAVCLSENSRAIAAAAYLPDKVYSSEHTLQVMVYQRMNAELLRQINENKRYHGKLKAFGMNKGGYDASMIELSEFVDKFISDAYDKFQEKRKKQRERVCPLKDATTCTSEKKPVQSKVEEPEGKSKSARWWSNKYNIYTLWTKCRCMSACPSELVDKGFEPSMMQVLGTMEHNRWLVEQLLLRYRPLTKEEQEKAKVVDLCSSTAEKNKLKAKFAHLDICSNARLDEVDYQVSELDQALIEVLPEAYRKYLEKKKKGASF